MLQSLEIQGLKAFLYMSPLSRQGVGTNLDQIITIIVNLVSGHLAQQLPFAERLGDQGGTSEDIRSLTSLRAQSRNRDDADKVA